jgi:hypothetical protein
MDDFVRLGGGDSFSSHDPPFGDGPWVEGSRRARAGLGASIYRVWGMYGS